MMMTGRWAACRPIAFATPTAHEGGAAPAGNGVVSGEFGAPATTAKATYPATIAHKEHRPRMEVRSATASGGRIMPTPSLRDSSLTARRWPDT